MPQLLEVVEAVWNDAERRGFAGWDPYDGLNSPVFRATPFARIPKARQAWIQLTKHAPLNIRPLTGQRPEVLAKGMALFALGAWRLAGLGGPYADTWRRRGTAAIERMLTLRSPGFEEICFGYPYDWQSRAFFQPRNAPNLICSVFAAMAVERRLDGGDAETVPRDVCRFVTRHLLRKDGGVEWITYTPTTATQVHNVNMLGAALLAREARRTADAALGRVAREAMRFSVDRLRPDGTWPYGEAANQAWVDNFHTGYNLVALLDYRRSTGETAWDSALDRGYERWNTAFGAADGSAPYYDSNPWPIDIHSCAMAILTWLDFADRDPAARPSARRGADWTLKEMWDGHADFTFQRHRFWRNRVPQIRWGQAWMFWALAELAAAESERREGSGASVPAAPGR